MNENSSVPAAVKGSSVLLSPNMIRSANAHHSAIDSMNALTERLKTAVSRLPAFPKSQIPFTIKTAPTNDSPIQRIWYHDIAWTLEQ